jgi:hypothetical protein
MRTSHPIAKRAETDSAMALVVLSRGVKPVVKNLRELVAGRRGS